MSGYTYEYERRLSPYLYTPVQNRTRRPPTPCANVDLRAHQPRHGPSVSPRSTDYASFRPGQRARREASVAWPRRQQRKDSRNLGRWRAGPARPAATDRRPVGRDSRSRIPGAAGWRRRGTSAAAPLLPAPRPAPIPHANGRPMSGRPAAGRDDAPSAAARRAGHRRGRRPGRAWPVGTRPRPHDSAPAGRTGDDHAANARREALAAKGPGIDEHARPRCLGAAPAGPPPLRAAHRRERSDGAGGGPRPQERPRGVVGVMKRRRRSAATA